MAQVSNAQNAAPAKVDTTTGERIVPVASQDPSNKGVATTTMDLDRDFNINGVQYNKGDKVKVASAHVEAIKELQESNQAYGDAVAVHHGAVPAPKFPEEATAQTPTRPLGGAEMRQDLVTKVTTEDSPLLVVDDQRNTKEVKSQDEAAKVNAEQVERGKLFDLEK